MRSPFFSESLIDRLRDLVSKYPKGLGLVKEFLQNADDAGASRLRVTFDHRRHAGTLTDPGMNVALGPALLIENDRPFTSEDLQHVKTLGDSAKLRDAARTGRFGQGLTTWFSVTDHPSLMTADTLMWFDPHRTILDRSDNGYAWRIAEASARWPAWVKTFKPASFSREALSHDGAIFRLPLRTTETAPQSKIKKEAFSVDDWEEIVRQTRAIGPALLVFLRSIASLEMDEIKPDGSTVLRLSLTTANIDAVIAGRAALREAVRGSPAELLRYWLANRAELPQAAFTHVFNVRANGVPAAQSTWEVVSGLVRGPEDSLLREALELCELDEKAIPWAGAAWLHGSSTASRGGLSCFLPLPETPTAPVWLHGWFAIDSSRRSIAQMVEVDELVKRRVRWNSSLMRYGVGPAWAKLMERLHGEAPKNENPYVLWPRQLIQDTDVYRALHEGFYAAISSLPVFRVRKADHTWQRVADSFIDLPSNWHESLEGLIRSSGKAVTDPPLPTQIRESLVAAGSNILHLTPGRARAVLARVVKDRPFEGPLKDAPSRWLSQRKWVLSLAQFCASDGKQHLNGLPLALLSNERIRCFSTRDPVYVSDANGRRLLAALPHRTLDPEFQSLVLGDTPAPEIGVLPLDVAGLATIASEVQANRSDDASWLTAFFERLESSPTKEIVAHKHLLCSIPLVPNSDATRVAMGTVQTPMIVGEISTTLVASLKALGMPVMEAPPDLAENIAQFALRNPGFVPFVTPRTVACLLSRHSAHPSLHLEVLDQRNLLAPLLDFFSHEDGLNAIRERSTSLRTLPLLPTRSGMRVSANSENVFTTGGFTPPDGLVSQLEIVDTGPNARWAVLVKALDVPLLDAQRFVLDVLLPSFSQGDRATHLRLLRWLRDEYPRLAAGLREVDRERLRSRIRGTPILPLRGGGLGTPENVYAPEAREPDEVLGSRARQPDRRWCNAQADLWKVFFDWLSLPRRPLARDLYEAIISFSQQSNTQGVATVQDALLALAKHVSSRWAELHPEFVAPGVTFGAALRVLSWLPARRGNARDAAAAVVPEERLYSATELAAFRRRHLIASVHPLLAGEQFDKAMEEGLGLQCNPQLEEVLAHLDRLREMRPSSAKEQELVKTSFVEIIDFIGGTETLDPIDRWLAERPGERLVLLQGRWHVAERVFLQALRVAFPGAMSLQGDADLAVRARKDSVRAGLLHLGVRDAPTGADWIGVLEELARIHADEVLPEESLKIARGALRELGREEVSWLAAQSVWVPTQSRRLTLAREALLPDDYRLSRGTPEWLPLVENIQEIMDVARQAGARPLRSELKDALHPDSVESIAPQHRQWCRTLEERIHSGPFAQALRRIAYEQALRDELLDPVAAADDVDVDCLRRLRICVAERLRLQSRLGSPTGPVVFDYAAASFVDETSTLWVAAASEQKMLDEAVRVVARQSLVQDTLTVSRLLSLAPGQMLTTLDEYGMASIPAGRAMAEDDVAAYEGLPPPTAEAVEFLIPALDDGACSEEALDQEGTRDAAYNIEDDSSGAPRARPDLPWAGPDGTGTLGKRTFFGTPGLVGRVDPDAPRELTSGSSVARDSNSPRSSRSAAQGTNRLRAYLHAIPELDYDSSVSGLSETSGEEVRAAAFQAVQAREAEQGRTIISANAFMDGFDLTSVSGTDQRHVRILAIDGPWTPRGVGLSKVDIEASYRLGDKWWIYVVEHARDPARRSIHAIHGLLRHAAEVRIDSGWKSVAQNPTVSSATCRPTVGESVKLDDGSIAMIVGVESEDALPDVVLQFPDGTTKTVMWRPIWGQR